jgi:hypothetical protein
MTNLLLWVEHGDLPDVVHHECKRILQTEFHLCQDHDSDLMY